MAELVIKTRRRRGDVDADDAAYGLTALSAELLRAAGKELAKVVVDAKVEKEENGVAQPLLKLPR